MAENLYPWLSPIYQQISQAFAQGHGHHALLFKAEAGLGVEQLIKALAGRLFCTNEQEQPCQHCQGCHLWQSNNHPDFHLLAPIDNKDIGVDQVREVNEKLLQFAQQQGNKVVYVQGVERLTEAAANALLKTLEEPRPQTYFLLQADASASLLATIYSRCQVWLVSPPSHEIALDWLQQQPELAAQKTLEKSTALLVNYGRPLAALAMLQNGWGEKRIEFLRQFWRFFQRRDPLLLLPAFDKEILLQQLDWLSAFISDSLKARLQISQYWINQDLARGVQQFAEQQTALGLLQAQQIIRQMHQDLSQINGVNQELILLDGLTKLITQVFEE